VDAVRGTELADEIRTGRADEARLLNVVCPSHGQHHPLPVEVCRHMRWAMDVVASRAAEGPSNDVVLLPVHDMSNHHYHGSVTSLQIEGPTFPHTIHWVTKQRIPEGEFLSMYGEQLGNALLLATYGFSMPGNPHSRVLVAPHLKAVIESRYQLTRAEAEILEQIGHEARYAYAFRAPTALVAAFRFMLLKGSGLPCTPDAWHPFSGAGDEMKAVALARDDISKFDQQVPGNSSHDGRMLKDIHRLPLDMQQAVLYRVEQRTIVRWHVEWLSQRHHELEKLAQRDDEGGAHAEGSTIHQEL